MLDQRSSLYVLGCVQVLDIASVEGQSAWTWWRSSTVQANYTAIYPTHTVSRYPRYYIHHQLLRSRYAVLLGAWFVQSGLDPVVFASVICRVDYLIVV